MTQHVFDVQGMTCGHCERAVQGALRALDPAAETAIDRTQNRVVVTSELPRETLAAAIREEGYRVAC